MRVTWKHIVVTAIIAVLAYLSGKRCEQESFENSFKTDSVITRLDTVQIDTSAPSTIIRRDTVQVLNNVDTAAIISAWAERKTYKSEVEAKEVRIKAKPVVFQNRLDSISFDITNMRPTEIEYRSLKQPKNKISVGTIVGMDLVAPSVSYKRNRLRLSAGYDILSSNSTGLLIGVEYQILEW